MGDLSPSLTSAFVTLFATIGPIETAVLFVSLTGGVDPVLAFSTCVYIVVSLC